MSSSPLECQRRRSNRCRRWSERSSARSSCHVRECGFAEHQQVLELELLALHQLEARGPRRPDNAFFTHPLLGGPSGAAVARRPLEDAEASFGLELASDVLQEDGGILARGAHG